VSFPYLSQLLAARERLASLLDRGIAVTATASGLVLATFAAAAPGLVPSLFGEQWRESAVIVQWVCGSLMVAGPISVVGVGYLFAAGLPSVVLRATILHTLVLFAVTFPLLPVAGPSAIGIGSLAGAVVDAVVMGRAVAVHAGAHPFRPLAAPLAAALLAAALGTLLTATAGDDLLAACAGGAAAAAVYVAILATVRQRVLLETAGLALATARSAFGREAPAIADPSV
jgi:O-antigen/teichoic acid export membrane protein